MALRSTVRALLVHLPAGIDGFSGVPCACERQHSLPAESRTTPATGRLLMGIVPNPRLAPLDETDPDDYRPRSRWAVLADPVTDDGQYVRDLVVVLERIAPGDAVPLHRHPVDEVVVVESGEVEVRLGAERRLVSGRSVAFVPAGTPHGARNVGDEDAIYTAFFATPSIEIEYLERNPAPGTEGNPPQPPVTYDARG